MVRAFIMVRWVVESMLHGVDPLSYFSFQPVLHDWCNKGRGMCYPVCGMVHMKEPLLLIEKSSPCGGSGFPLSLSEWSFTICLTLYNRQPVVHNWFIKGRGMYCSVYGKVHIKDPLLLIEKSSLCGGSGFPSKKCVNVTI